LPNALKPPLLSTLNGHDHVLCMLLHRRERARSERPGRPDARAATKAPAELSPVQLVLELPSGGATSHDFKASPMCELPVKVVLRNTSRVFAVRTLAHARTHARSHHDQDRPGQSSAPAENTCVRS
jgi:hypothetical protein